MITGEQLRGARAMLGWDQAELAEKADVTVKTIKRMEGQSGPINARSNWSVIRALEFGGIEFLDGNDGWRSGGAGIRFSKDPTGKVRRALVEDICSSLEIDLKLHVERDPDFFERSVTDIVDTVVEDVRENLQERLKFILRKQDEPSDA
jgi:DNA-binding XRE family transcriptional regulator